MVTLERIIELLKSGEGKRAEEQLELLDFETQDA